MFHGGLFGTLFLGRDQLLSGVSTRLQKLVSCELANRHVHTTSYIVWAKQLHNAGKTLNNKLTRTHIRTHDDDT